MQSMQGRRSPQAGGDVGVMSDKKDRSPVPWPIPTYTTHDGCVVEYGSEWRSERCVTHNRFLHGIPCSERADRATDP